MKPRVAISRGGLRNWEDRRMEREICFWMLFFACGCVWLMARWIKLERNLLDEG